jgi:hypothetical protein
MSSLANQQQKLSFPGLLQVPGGITSSLQQVQDGNGNPTGLSLSSAGASVTTSSTFQASSNGTTITGALPRLISDGFGDQISVKDFGAVGNGIADDTAAIQAAIDYAQNILTNPNVLSGRGMQILFPSGIYLISSTLYITSNGIGVIGEVGKGAVIQGDCNLFNIGDYTDTLNTYQVGYTTFQNIRFASTNMASAYTAVILYRTMEAKVINCTFLHFNVGIASYASTTTLISGCDFRYGGRITTDPLAAIVLYGIDASSFVLPSTNTPGGGMHITDCEILGNKNDNTLFLNSGILVKSCDGLYVENTHIAGCSNSVLFQPDGTSSSYMITDVMMTNCYFDNPASVGTSINVNVSGIVNNGIPRNNLSTVTSVYQNIRFCNSFFRGNNEADTCLMVRVTDANSWVGSINRLSNFSFIGCTFCQAKNMAVFLQGSATVPSYVEVSSAKIIGCDFYSNNSSNSTGIGSAIYANCESIIVNSCTFRLDTGTTDYIILIQATYTATHDRANPSCIVSENDLSKATTPALGYIRITPSAVDVNTQQNNNLLKGSGRFLNETYKLTTTDATTKTLFSYDIPVGTSGTIKATLVASGSGGTNSLSYEFSCGFRRTSVGMTLSTATTSWSTDSSWNPDSFPTIPVAILDITTLKINVTGIAATSINWCSTVVMTLSR